ncbi:MAG: hypothetical protein L0Y62_06585 [Nitrospirae bacterium]|nr:hypothetical protein [Nitrospirota bacterium]
MKRHNYKLLYGLARRFFYIASILILMVGCGGKNGSADAERKNVYYEHELNDAVRAYPENIVILKLESADNAALKGTLTSTSLIKNIIPYEYRKDDGFKFCIKDDEPHITSALLLDSSGKAVVSINKGECVNKAISAGKYEMHAYHDSAGIDKEALAFVHISNTPKLPTANSGAWAIRAENGKMLAAVQYTDDPSFHIEANSTSVGDKGLFNVISDSNGVYFSAFFNNQLLFDSSFSVIYLLKEDKPFEGSYNDTLNSGFKLILNGMGSYSFHYIIEYTDYYGKFQDHCLYVDPARVNLLM